MKQQASKKQKEKNKVVMVFGVFDGLHKGHLFFLRKASRMGGALTVVVARDDTVMRLKKKTPRMNERERMRAVSRIPYVVRVALGDKKEGVYTPVKRYKPDCLCLGYDQKALARDLRAKMRARTIPRISLAWVTSFRPKRYHTSRISAQLPLRMLL